MGRTLFRSSIPFGGAATSTRPRRFARSHRSARGSRSSLPMSSARPFAHPRMRRIEFRWRRRVSHPRTWWWFATALMVLSVIQLESLRSEAFETQQRWHGTVSVPQARSPIPAGAKLTGDDIEWTELPPAAVPDEPLLLEGQTGYATTDISAGEILLSSRFTEPAQSQVARALPEGTQAVAVPRSATDAPAERGDHLDLWVPGRSQPIASRVTVIHTTEEAITFAAPSSRVSEISDALFAGALRFTLRGPE